MGGYAEKVLRLVVCEGLTTEAPGIEYAAKMIADMRICDPWRANPEYETPPIVLKLIKLKEALAQSSKHGTQRKLLRSLQSFLPKGEPRHSPGLSFF